MITSASVFPKRSRSIPSARPTGKGLALQPDVKVKSADALETAVKLIETKVEKKQLCQ